MKYEDVKENDYAVFKDAAGWCVIRKGSKRCAAVDLKKPEAIAYAKALTKKRGVAYFVVDAES